MERVEKSRMKERKRKNKVIGKVGSRDGRKGGVCKGRKGEKEGSYNDNREACTYRKKISEKKGISLPNL